MLATPYLFYISGQGCNGNNFEIELISIYMVYSYHDIITPIGRVVL